MYADLMPPFFEEKDIKHVATAAGVRKYGMPIGSIIVNHDKLKHLIHARSEFAGWAKVHGADGGDYYIVNDPEHGWIGTRPDDTIVVYGRSEEEVYKRLDYYARPKRGRNPVVVGHKKPGRPKPKPKVTLADYGMQRPVLPPAPVAHRPTVRIGKYDVEIVEQARKESLDTIVTRLRADGRTYKMIVYRDPTGTGRDSVTIVDEATGRSFVERSASNDSFDGIMVRTTARNKAADRAFNRARRTIKLFSDEFENKLRHVRTAAGVRRYHKPIGAVIAPDYAPSLPGMLPLKVPLPENFLRPTPTDVSRVRNFAEVTPGEAEATYRRLEKDVEDYLADESNSLEPPRGINLEDIYPGDEPPPVDYAVAAGDWVYFGGARDIRRAADELLGFDPGEDIPVDPGVSYGYDPGWGGAGTEASDPKRDALILLYSLSNSLRGRQQLYRGVASPPPQMLDSLQKGSTFDLPLASFTDKQSDAARFGSDLMFQLEGEMHSVAGGEMSQDAIEFISGGRFKVVGIQHHRTYGGLTREGLKDRIYDLHESGLMDEEFDDDYIDWAWRNDEMEEIRYALSRAEDRLVGWGEMTLVRIQQIGVFNPDTGLLVKAEQGRVPRWKWAYIFDYSLVPPLTKTKKYKDLLSVFNEEMAWKIIVRHVRNPNYWHMPVGTPITGRQRAILRTINAVRAPNSGYSARLDGRVPRHGFMVSELKHGERIPASEFLNPDKGKIALRRFIERNQDAFDDPDTYIGLWHSPSNDEICLDVSHNIDSREEAIRMGRRENQEAIYDVEANIVIDTGGTGQKDLRQAKQEVVRDD